MIKTLIKIDCELAIVDKIMNTSLQKIGVFDSGIGGFSVLAELMKLYPEAQYYYYSDDAHAPYGPKSDEEIRERSIHISEEMIKKEIDFIVVACNTATAAAIDQLRSSYPQLTFVGVEPYINAYYKVSTPAKMAVLTTESTGKSERFKKLKERLDPQKLIDHYGLKLLAKLVEDFFNQKITHTDFREKLKDELSEIKKHNYTHVILGCTHYPLVRKEIEDELQVEALCPCPYVALRVVELLSKQAANKVEKLVKPREEEFYFYSSSVNQWVTKKRNTFLDPFKK